MCIKNIKTGLSKYIEMWKYTEEELVAIYRFYSSHKDYSIKPSSCI